MTIWILSLRCRNGLEELVAHPTRAAAEAAFASLPVEAEWKYDWDQACSEIFEVELPWLK